jgi:hypothetical protein
MIVLKYPLEVTEGEHLLHIPVGAEFLSVQVQENKPYAYFKAEPDFMDHAKTITYITAWTGRDQKKIGKFNTRYLGTAITQPLVLHYFTNYIV